jgi:hypothetical protein
MTCTFSGSPLSSKSFATTPDSPALFPTGAAPALLGDLRDYPDQQE